MGTGLSVKRLLGLGKRSSMDSCRLLGMKKKACKKSRMKVRKVRRKLRRRL